MSTFTSILWQEYVLFKRKFWTITLAAMVSPILYLIAFGWGIGGSVTVEGKSYINFIIPGIIALTTMTVIHSHQCSSYYFSYAIGKIVAGALMGMYSALLIITLSLIAGTGISISPYFILIIILNCLTFSAIGFTVGIFINSHTEMSKFSSFVITPMSFLCGTFFSLDKMPQVIKIIIWMLPLTHTSLGLRNSGKDLMDMIIHPIVLSIYFILIFCIGVMKCKKAE